MDAFRTHLKRVPTLSAFAVVSGLLHVSASAQPSDGSVPAEAAHLFAYSPRERMEALFEEGYRRHLDWHRRNHDPLVWYAWRVSDGDRAGLFVDGTFGQPFSAFDTRVDPAGDGSDADQTFIPFVKPAFRSAYVLRRDLSTGFPLEEHRPTPSMHVVEYAVRPGTEARFERAVQAASEALQGRSDVPDHTWYALVVGGTAPSYLLVVARTDWSDYDHFRAGLSTLIADGREAAEAARLLEDFAASVDHVRVETWTYLPHLSLLPETE